jgi:hypothetical protein
VKHDQKQLSSLAACVAKAEEVVVLGGSVVDALKPVHQNNCDGQSVAQKSVERYFL